MCVYIYICIYTYTHRFTLVSGGVAFKPTRLTQLVSKYERYMCMCRDV